MCFISSCQDGCMLRFSAPGASCANSKYPYHMCGVPKGVPIRCTVDSYSRKRNLRSRSEGIAEGNVHKVIAVRLCIWLQCARASAISNMVAFHRKHPQKFWDFGTLSLCMVFGSYLQCTGLGNNTCTWLRECCNQATS